MNDPEAGVIVSGTIPWAPIGVETIEEEWQVVIHSQQEFDAGLLANFLDDDRRR